MSTAIARAQLTVDPTASPATAVANLLGSGVDASNITFTGPTNQIGTFLCNSCGIGFGSGVIMATGNVDVAEGPNNIGSSTLGGGNFGATDGDLQILNPGVNFNDAVVLQFDFVAQGDSVSFNYVFGSEEYPEYSGSGFNDTFGFFLSGPGITGPYSNNAVNIALIPNTTLPVAINSVNAGTNDLGCNNCAYYVINTFNNAANGVQFDGYTVPLVASYSGLQCGETYHIKIAIADAGDTSFDSAVFIEESSFFLSGLEIDLVIPQIGLNDSTIYEGCGTSYFEFTRLSSILSEESFTLTVSGTATPDADYPALPTEITFFPGIQTVEVPFSAFNDGITEGLETVEVSYFGDDGCGNVEDHTVTFYIGEPEPLVVELVAPSLDCGESATLTPTISGGYGVYSMEWFDGSTEFSTTVSPGITTSYSYVVSDTCGIPPFQGNVLVDVAAYPPLTVNSGGPISINCLEIVESTAIASGGNGIYFYQWFDPFGNPISGTADVQYDPNAESSLTVEVIDGCGITADDELDFTFYDVPVEVDLPSGLSLPCLDNIVVVPDDVSGGIGALSYAWEVNGIASGGASQINVTMSTNDIAVELTVEDQCGNVGNDQIVIEFIPTPINLSLPASMNVDCLGAFTITPEIFSGGVGTFTYAWTSEGGITGNNSSINASLIENDVFTLEVNDGCGNSAEDATVVSIIPEVVLVDLGQDQFVPCEEFVFLDPTITGGVGPYDYEWTSNQLDAGAASTLEVFANGFIPVSVQITDQCGNVGSDAMQISIPTLPPALVISNDSTICLGGHATLEVEILNPLGNYAYTWLPGYVSSPSITVYPNETTQYSVYVVDQCGNSSFEEVTIHVEDVTANFDFDYTEEWGIETYNVSAPETSFFLWDFDDGEVSTEFEPVH
ncbi:MAG: hypothetical protein RL226_2394, partial [Bacteroidota bacterium]